LAKRSLTSRPNPMIEAFNGRHRASGIVANLQKFVGDLKPADDDRDEKQYLAAVWNALVQDEVALEITRSTLTSLYGNVFARTRYFYMTYTNEKPEIDFMVWLTFGGNNAPACVRVRALIADADTVPHDPRLATRSLTAARGSFGMRFVSDEMPDL